MLAEGPSPRRPRSGDRRQRRPGQRHMVVVVRAARSGPCRPWWRPATDNPCSSQQGLTNVRRARGRRRQPMSHAPAPEPARSRKARRDDRAAQARAHARHPCSGLLAGRESVALRTPASESCARAGPFRPPASAHPAGRRRQAPEAKAEISQRGGDPERRHRRDPGDRHGRATPPEVREHHAGGGPRRDQEPVMEARRRAPPWRSGSCRRSRRRRTTRRWSGRRRGGAWPAFQPRPPSSGTIAHSAITTNEAETAYLNQAPRARPPVCSRPARRGHVVGRRGGSNIPSRIGTGRRNWPASMMASNVVPSRGSHAVGTRHRPSRQPRHGLEPSMLTRLPLCADGYSPRMAGWSLAANRSTFGSNAPHPPLPSFAASAVNSVGMVSTTVELCSAPISDSVCSRRSSSAAGS